MFIEKYFVSNGLFKLNVLAFIDSKNSSFTSSTSSTIVLNIESCDIWYARLGHVNLKSILKLTNLNFVPKLKIDSKSNVIFVPKLNNLENLLNLFLIRFLN